uniref:TMV resistance protein N-like n=1 Tax=Rhabditophanes sp. KR3021 TaxID=114890 RepID=A0AC35TP71_9BILA
MLIQNGRLLTYLIDIAQESLLPIPVPPQDETAVTQTKNWLIKIVEEIQTIPAGVELMNLNETPDEKPSHSIIIPDDEEPERIDGNKIKPSVLEDANQESIVGPMNKVGSDEEEEVHDSLDDYMKPDEACFIECA